MGVDPKLFFWLIAIYLGVFVVLPTVGATLLIVWLLRHFFG